MIYLITDRMLNCSKIVRSLCEITGKYTNLLLGWMSAGWTEEHADTKISPLPPPMISTDNNVTYFLGHPLYLQYCYILAILLNV